MTSITSGPTNKLNLVGSTHQPSLTQSTSMTQSILSEGKLEEEMSSSSSAAEGVVIKPENIFEILNSKNNIDILCIKAKNAHDKYDISKAYEICVK